jgi:hypothetical protein
VIKIRQATLADKQAIFEFLARAYTDKSQYKFPQRWEWQFENNPFRKAKEDELPIWLAVDEDGTIVGQTCVMFEPLKIGSENHHTLSWAADTIVLPEYRRQKLAYRLKKASIEDSDIYMSLMMAAATRHIYMSLACVPVDSAAVFARMAHQDAPSTLAALEKRLPNKWPGKVLLWVLHFLWLDQLVTALLNAGVAVRGLGLSRYVDTDIGIKQIDEFDRTVDDFWNEVSPHFHAIVQRSSKYLNWKYVQQPHMYYQLFTAFRDGRICGYVILRKTRPPESNLGIIADLFVPPEDKAAIYSLLVFAVRHLKGQKARFIVAASTIDAYKSALVALGFTKRGEQTPIFHSRIKTPAMESVLAPGAWFLGRGDHDWDEFPYA